MKKDEFHFDWDPGKARANLGKHGVSFVLASSVFYDALAITIYDDEHSETEQRWVTIGQAVNGQLLVVTHTFIQIEAGLAELRLISARRADRLERQDYEQAPH